MKKQNSKNINFKSNNDYLFYLIILGTSFLLFVMALFVFLNTNGIIECIEGFLLLIISLFLFWTFFGTKYKLSAKELKCFSGPFQKTVKIDTIVNIKMGTTMWSGYRLATARNGLIITYNKYDQIYISPKTNEKFVKEILKINPNIKTEE